MKWEKIDSSVGCIYRSKVPTGWLVMCVDEVMTIVNTDMPIQAGYEWRSSITFVSDPNHMWSLSND